MQKEQDHRSRINKAEGGGGPPPFLRCDLYWDTHKVTRYFPPPSMCYKCTETGHRREVDPKKGGVPQLWTPLATRKHAQPPVREITPP